MPTTAATPQQIGPYRIEAELNHARSVLLYQAYDTLYDRPVLLRVLPPHLAQDATLVRAFISAGREAARLRHPNLVQVYEAGQADGVNYIAQEFVNGGTLAERLHSRHQPYVAYDMVAMVDLLAQALDYAHTQGHSHGALTADSVYFTSDNLPKIADIGLTHLATLGENTAFITSVSPFMAPEQARGEGEIDRRADLYTLGVLSFMMLTGRPPFVADNPLALVRRIIDEAPPLQSASALIPADFVPTLQRILAKAPNDRHPTAVTFARALIYGEPPVAPVVVPAPVLPVDLPTTSPVEVNTVEAPATLPATTPVISPYAPRTAWTVPAPVAPLPVVERLPVPLPAAMRPTRPARQLRYLPLSLLGALSLALTLATLLRVAWGAFGEQMVGVAMTPYAVAQASRLTPPLPPTMLTIADTPLFGENGLLLSGDQDLILTLSSGDALNNSSALTGTQDAPPAVVVLPSDTPTVRPTTPPVATPTKRSTDTPFPTDTPVPSPTLPPTATALPSPTPSPTLSPTPEPSATVTETPTATATVAPSPTLSPTASPTATAVPVADLAGRIAYTRWDPRVDRYELIFYSIERGESWPIVPNRRQPDFGPQGQLVASGDGGFIDNLILMATNGENPQPISAHPEDAHPHWAPSGKLVVFDSTQVGDGRHRLYLQRDEDFGRPTTPMMFEAWELFGQYPIFLADGEIAYNGCDVWENASNCGIFLVDTTGAKPDNVTTWPRDIPTDNLGNQILTMSDRGGNWDIYRIDPASGAVQPLTDSPGRDGLATASPDGSSIAFVSDRDGAWAVYAMRSDGSDQRKLFDLEGGFGSGDRDWLQERISWGQ